MLTTLANNAEVIRRWCLAYVWGNEAPDYAGLIYVACVLVCIVVPYLLGSLNFALIFSKFIKHEDIRNYGSGNAGMTNVLRTYGKGMAAITLICDMAKGAISVVLGTILIENEGAMIAGLFCILGHIFPCFYKFKGGKGVATTAVVVTITSPIVGAILIVLFIAIVAVTKYISLGSVMCMFLYPILLWAFPMYRFGLNNIIAVIIAALVIFMHRSNIKRLYEGKENKLSLKHHGKKAADGADSGKSDSGENK